MMLDKCFDVLLTIVLFLDYLVSKMEVLCHEICNASAVRSPAAHLVTDFYKNSMGHMYWPHKIV
jgi:hypothetical protein